MDELLTFVKPYNTVINARDFSLMMSGHVIFFGRGSFDDYCAYVAGFYNGQWVCAMPRDSYYFSLVRSFAEKYGNRYVYDDIKHIYEITGNTIEQSVLAEIYKLSRYYENGDLWYDMMLHIYYGMVAEENKANAVVGKAMKMDGLYDLLIENKDMDYSCNRNCRRSASDIVKECRERHIYRYVKNGV